jgi:hypothetical protein
MTVALDPANDLGLGSNATTQTATMQDISAFNSSTLGVSNDNLLGENQSSHSIVPENLVPNMQEPMANDFPMPQNDTASNFLFVVSIMLFCVSFGVAVYFILQYFKVI